MSPDQTSPAPTVSADGRFWYDGQRWVPFPVVGPSAAAVAGRLFEQVLGFLIQLVVVLVAFPLVLVLAVSAAVWAVPERFDDVAAIATVVVCVGAVWPLTRAISR